MYKRMAMIGLLMGLPIFLLPSQQPTPTRAGGSIEVAGAVQTAPVFGSNDDPTDPDEEDLADALITAALSSTTLDPTPESSETVSTTTAPRSTTAPSTSRPPTTTQATAAPSTTQPTESTAPTTTNTSLGVAISVVRSTTTTETTLPPTTAAPTPTERGQAALSAIGYDWQGRLGGWTIEFSPGRDGVIGYTYTYEHRIEIFVRDDMSEGLLRHVIAHEIGHAVDVTLNSSADRERWQELRGIGASPWWPGNGVSDYSTGAGDFAECFAAWQVGTSVFRSKIGGAPNGDQLALVAELAAG